MTEAHNVDETRESTNGFDGAVSLDVDLGDAIEETKHQAWPPYWPDATYHPGYFM